MAPGITLVVWVPCMRIHTGMTLAIRKSDSEERPKWGERKEVHLPRQKQALSSKRQLADEDLGLSYRPLLQFAPSAQR